MTLVSRLRQFVEFQWRKENAYLLYGPINRDLHDYELDAIERITAASLDFFRANRNAPDE